MADIDFSSSGRLRRIIGERAGLPCSTMYSVSLIAAMHASTAKILPGNDPRSRVASTINQAAIEEIPQAAATASPSVTVA